MKFTNTEQAKNTILEGHKLCQKAMKVGDAKTNNNIIRNQINPAYEYLKKQGKMNELIEFLENDDVNFKMKIAKRLLPYYEEISTDILNRIIEMDIEGLGWKAEIIMREWNK